MGVYYNENDLFAAAWLRALIFMGEIADGDVDERSIEDVTVADLKGYDQHHFFAGIGVWSRALRDAGWPDDRPVWTGSCPCQPFSAAGKGGGFADERHLWPAWFWLLEQHRPDVVFGEQIAAKAGLEWFDLVSSDLEGAGYAVGAADLSAAGVGAPHIRQRLWWVAHHHHGQGRRQREECDGWPYARDQVSRRHDFGRCGGVGLADGEGSGRNTGEVSGAQGGAERRLRCQPDQLVVAGSMVDPASKQARLPRCPWEPGGAMAHHHARLEVERQQPAWEHRQQQTDGRLGLVDITSSARQSRRLSEPLDEAGRSSRCAEPGRRSLPWGEADWIACRDGKWRPIEPGTFPLAHGAPARVGRLRGYGNAIVLPLATVFIEEAMMLL